MSVLTPEAMLTSERLPECTLEELAALNMELVRELAGCEFGTDAYYEAIAKFHDRAANRCGRPLYSARTTPLTAI